MLKHRQISGGHTRKKTNSTPVGNFLHQKKETGKSTYRTLKFCFSLRPVAPVFFLERRPPFADEVLGIRVGAPLHPFEMRRDRY